MYSGIKNMSIVSRMIIIYLLGPLLLFVSFCVIMILFMVSVMEEKLQLSMENKVREERENRQKHIKADVVLTCPEKECYILSCIANQNLDLLSEKYKDFFKNNRTGSIVKKSK